MLFNISNSKLGIWLCSQPIIDLNSQSNFYDVLTRPYKYLSNNLSTLSTTTTCTQHNLYVSFTILQGHIWCLRERRNLLVIKESMWWFHSNLFWGYTYTSTYNLFYLYILLVLLIYFTPNLGDKTEFIMNSYAILLKTYYGFYSTTSYIYG